MLQPGDDVDDEVITVSCGQFELNADQTDFVMDSKCVSRQQVEDIDQQYNNNGRLLEVLHAAASVHKQITFGHEFAQVAQSNNAAWDIWRSAPSTVTLFCSFGMFQVAP